MSSSVLYNNVFQAKINNVQNQADTSAVYSAGVWSFKNSTALTSVTITDAGNVGIGTSSPTAIAGYTALTLNNATTGSFIDLKSGNTLYGRLLATTSAVNLSTEASIPLVFQTNQAERMRLDAVGALTVGSSGSTISHTIQAPSNPAGTAAVHVRKQNVAINSSGNSYVEFYGSSGGFDGYLGISGTTLQVIDASDSRKKENVRPANYGLNEIKALNPVVYDWKEEFGGEKNIKGFLAQEVKQILPECVTIQDESERGGFSDSYFLGTANMIPVLVAAIQELSAKVDAQAEEIKALKAQP